MTDSPANSRVACSSCSTACAASPSSANATLSTTNRSAGRNPCGLEQISSAFTADAVVCLSRSRREVREEIHDDLRADLLRDPLERFVVVDVAEDWFGAKVSQGLQLLARSCQPDDLVSREVWEGRAA